VVCRSGTIVSPVKTAEPIECIRWCAHWRNLANTIEPSMGGGDAAFFTARSELRKVLFLALSMALLFVYEIYREPLNGFAPNLHGRRVWSLARTSLKVKVKGGHLES